MQFNLAFYVIPVLLVLIVVESIYSWKENKAMYAAKDSFNNLLIGLVYFALNLVAKLGIFYLLQSLFQYRLFNISMTWGWVLAFLGCDLSYYWYHRASHKINFFWASHVVHHSSKKFNLTVGFRLPWTHHISGSFLFWLWMPLVGFSPLMTLVCLQVCVLYQELLHTETVGKLHPVFEYIFNTPSHHRVHHSSNFQYLDKNHGGALIIWDRLFGTFEKEEERPRYGLTNNFDSSNTFEIMFQEWGDLFKKAAASGTFRNAFNYFIQAPGWSHDGSSQTVKQLRKVYKSDPVPAFEKCWEAAEEYKSANQ